MSVNINLAPETVKYAPPTIVPLKVAMLADLSIAFVLPQPRGWRYSSGKKTDIEKTNLVGMEGDKELWI